MRAAVHGRSMESEIRAILAEADSEPGDNRGLFATLLGRFGSIGGVELDLPERSTPVRAPNEDVLLVVELRRRPHTAHGDLTPAEFAAARVTTNQPQVV